MQITRISFEFRGSGSILNKKGFQNYHLERHIHALLSVNSLVKLLNQEAPSVLQNSGLLGFRAILSVCKLSRQDYDITSSRLATYTCQLYRLQHKRKKINHTQPVFLFL